MNFYIASSLNNFEQVRYAASLLKANGWTHTCDWTNFNLLSNHGSSSLQIIAENEYNGVKTADIVIVITPQGRGVHTELGMAIALGKRVYVCHTDNSYFKYDDNTCAFYWLPQVKQIIGKVDYAIEVILGENTGLNQ